MPTSRRRSALRSRDTYVRVEYAQDIDGFWLKPHTDIGVKMFTMLIYMSDDPRHADLGTDIYADENTHVGRSPFEPNAAMIFVPSKNTWHGFEKRPIHGVRRSIIVNYVTNDWRAREQLAFPQTPVSAARLRLLEPWATSRDSHPSAALRESAGPARRWN